ncbi:MAG: hypothetical protein WC769_01625 [Thermodesulfovibrionales bacterium]
MQAQDEPIVYITRSGSKYHKAGCSYLKKSSIPIKLSEVESQYSPCSRCNPPKLLHKDKARIKDKITTNEIDKNKVYTNEDLSDYTSSPSVSSNSGYTSSDYTSIPSASSDKKYTTEGIGTTSTGKTIYTGPRGGRYHYSSSGKKVYERKR